MKAVGRPLVATTAKATSRDRARRPGSGPRSRPFPLSALKLYGNAAVFTTLPPSTLGGTGPQVKIELSGPGSFAKVPPHGANVVPTITCRRR